MTSPKTTTTTTSGKDSKADCVEEELKQFDFVQFCVPDIHGIPRGRLVPSEMLARACRDGVGIFSGCQCFGFRTEVTAQLKDFQLFPNGTMRPLAGTVRPLLWSSTPKQRIGHVMCQLELQRQEVSESCSREAAERQVARLRHKGWTIKSAFECEFDVLTADSLEPLGGEVIPYANLDMLDRHLDLFTDMLRVLRGSGVHVEYFFPEYQGGQFEVSLQPLWGVASADNAFMLRSGVRAFCQRQGLTATFMPLPFARFHSAGLHFNHSLWSLEGCNLFRDDGDPLLLSALARHWIAGLLHHAPALCALCCPTTNCYRRLGGGFAPGVIYWNVDDRLSSVRAKTRDSNVFLENRIPSSACNPYLALAATIAAGLDGVERQLECPAPGPPGEGQGAVPALPKTLSEALDRLEEDSVLTEAVGSKLVSYFLFLKREFEVKHFRQVVSEDMGPAETVTKEREFYMPLL